MGGWLESDNKAISVQLNLTGTGIGTQFGNILCLTRGECSPEVNLKSVQALLSWKSSLIRMILLFSYKIAQSVQ